MMGERRIEQPALFYEFSLDGHVPQDHLLRAIDRFVDLEGVRAHLAPFYSAIGRPSIDPELMIRMLLIGYCMGVRSERRLCEEVHLNLAYRWFCRLGLDDDVPDHSTFSKNRHGRFRDSDLLRELFESVVRRCMAEGLVGGEGFAVDASIIRADASRHRTAVDGAAGLPAEAAGRAVEEYLAVLDDAAFGAATPVIPKYISLSDPASRWTAAQAGPASFAYCTNYLIDLDHAVIVDVEPSTAVRQGELAACRTMIERANDRLGLYQPRRDGTQSGLTPFTFSGEDQTVSDGKAPLIIAVRPEQVDSALALARALPVPQPTTKPADGGLVFIAFPPDRGTKLGSRQIRTCTNERQNRRDPQLAFSRGAVLTG